MSALLLCSTLMFADEPQVKPAPLTSAQYSQLRLLIQRTQERDRELKTALSQRQRELTLVYSQFEFSVDHAERLQSDIIELQRQLLANYHNLQTELRRIVGRERFEILKRRIDNALASDAKNTTRKSKSRVNGAESEKPGNNKSRSPDSGRQN